jgi:hypothetical protein
LHRGKDSLNDPEDDVFPRKVRVRVTIDSTLPRCVYTKLVDEIGDGEMDLFVDSIKGFPDGGDEDSFLLIDDEWIHYAKKANDHFYLDKRGARGTHAVAHKRDAVVRTGKTFERVVFVPGWREDFTPDEIYFARKRAMDYKPRTLTK